TRLLDQPLAAWLRGDERCERSEERDGGERLADGRGTHRLRSAAAPAGENFCGYAPSPGSMISAIRGPCTTSTMFAYDVISTPVRSSTSTIRRNACSRGNGSTPIAFVRGSNR